MPSSNVTSIFKQKWIWNDGVSIYGQISGVNVLKVNPISFLIGTEPVITSKLWHIVSIHQI